MICVRKEVGFELETDEIAESMSHASSSDQAEFFNVLAEQLDVACNATGGMDAQLVFVAPELSPDAVKMLEALLFFYRSHNEEEATQEEA